MNLDIEHLPWALLDPKRVAFDPTIARAVAWKYAAAWMTNRPRFDWREQFERDVDLALIDRHGVGVTGWKDILRDTRPPVPSETPWLPRPGDPEDYVAWVAGSVQRWRAFLEEVARVQAALRVETAGLPLDAQIERAATRYLPLVVEGTATEDAWYFLFELVVCWHVESLGVDDARVPDLVDRVVSGVFESWVEPAPPAAAGVASELGRNLAAAIATPAARPDALARWWSVRDGTRWRSFARERLAPVPATDDGHLVYVERHDLPRSAERARRMSDAIAFVRAEARAGRPLTWEMLCEAQCRVLGVGATGFRTGDAFSRGGRER